jgi:hypothetical protein
MGVLPTYVATFEPELVMLDLEPMAHPVLFLRHEPVALRQSRVQRVKEWLQKVFDPTHQPWYREEFIHPREFDRMVAASTAKTTLRAG